MKVHKRQKARDRHRQLVRQRNVARQEARKKPGVMRYYKEEHGTKRSRREEAGDPT